MNKLELKKELSIRYTYILSNAPFILSESIIDSVNLPRLIINKLSDETLQSLEELLLGEIPINENAKNNNNNHGYFYFELLKSSKIYRDLLCRNKTIRIEKYQSYLNAKLLLLVVKNYINCQQYDEINKKNKLDIINYYLELDGLVAEETGILDEALDTHLIFEPIKRSPDDYGVTNNDFIYSFCQNKIFLHGQKTMEEKEKQKQIIRINF